MSDIKGEDIDNLAEMLGDLYPTTSYQQDRDAAESLLKAGLVLPDLPRWKAQGSTVVLGNGHSIQVMRSSLGDYGLAIQLAKHLTQTEFLL